MPKVNKIGNRPIIIAGRSENNCPLKKEYCNGKTQQYYNTAKPYPPHGLWCRVYVIDVEFNEGDKEQESPKDLLKLKLFY
jgi:hypothetical protein